VTAVETLVGHEWRIVAPWWHWPLLDGAAPPGRLEDRRAVRVGAPVLQKYDGPHLVNTFLADPQRRLAFVDETDRVATISPGPLGSLPTRSVTDGARKLYLASHHRHYLVVCSLHCDAAGFPRARRDDVCEAGFVVRRRTGGIPGGPAGPAARALREWAQVQRKRRAVEQRLRTAGPLRQVALERRLAVLSCSEQKLESSVRAHATAALAAGPIRTLHGWVPVGVDDVGKPGPVTSGSRDRTPLAGVGAWLPMPEMPADLTEAAFPLTALVPDSTAPGHDAERDTIYFGVVPTGSSDVDTAGRARFDDEQDYEIRCFFRRHRPECPRDGAHCTCPITWSEPTEHYRLAGHFDLEGCANRPVTVQLPDLKQLHADVLRLGPGGAGGVRFSSPPDSELSFTTDDLTAHKAKGAMANGDFQICSFAIPLITIVAFFVLQLFLPIVIFVFQLWFMLMLRFCIPPDAAIGGGLLADFEALGGGLDIDAGVAVTVTSRQTFKDALAALLENSKPGGKRLDVELLTARSAPPPDTLDVRSLAAIGRGALAQKAPPPPARPFARRVARSEVVQP
jgi:hypothetical protein